MTTKNLLGLILGVGLVCGGVSAAPPSSKMSDVSPVILVPEEIVYTPELPTVADLTEGAALQGLTIEQVASSRLQTTVVYDYPNGKTKVVAFQLPPPENEPSSQPAASTPHPEASLELSPAHHAHDQSYPKYGYAPIMFRFGFASAVHDER